MLLKNIFHQKDDGIVVIRKTEPGTCGGTDATQDTHAPTEILSEEMTLFDVTSALNGGDLPSDVGPEMTETIRFVSAFAVPAGDGSFLFFEKGDSFRRRDDKLASWALVKENVFPSLVTLVRECELAKYNGFHSTTHGLPENFGGSADIRYASGERISFSNNQTPIISSETGLMIATFFTRAMKEETIPLPEIATLRTIRFEENRENGGFTKAVLTIHPDGTGTNEKSSRYDDPQIYESTKPVDKATIDAIKKNIEDTGLPAWSSLPENGYNFTNSDKTLTFVFADETTITVHDSRLVPPQLSRGFFNIELEMTTRH